MIIRKTFKAETAHIVRGAYSTKCDKNLHGHSYLYELFLSATELDNAGMVTDFTFVKKYFNPLFDSFDHASILMTSEKEEIKDCFLKNFERVVIADWNSTAELQSRFFTTISYFIIKYLNENNLWENGEQDVKVKSVRVHETKTGYAECIIDDLAVIDDTFTPIDVKSPYIKLAQSTKFSEGIQKDWSPEFKKFWDWFMKI